MTAETARVDIPDHAPHVLVVDDDRRLRDLLARFLVEHGYRVTTAASAAEARAKVGELRVRRPRARRDDAGESGFDYARTIRRTSQVPILMLTARAEHGRSGHRPRDRRRRLPAEALRAARADPPARQHPAARRSAARPSRPRRPGGDPLRPVHVPVRPRRPAPRRRGGAHHRARARDPDASSARRAGGNVAREELAGGGGAANERTVDVQINRLRRKIEVDPANPVFLQTVRGIGYRLVIDR